MTSTQQYLQYIRHCRPSVLSNQHCPHKFVDITMIGDYELEGRHQVNKIVSTYRMKYMQTLWMTAKEIRNFDLQLR